MSDPTECTCPSENGQRLKCADGQVMISGNCPQHGEPRPVKPRESCRWMQDADDGAWDTGCNERFEFTHGEPADNHFAFCPYCGGRIEQA